MNNSKSLAFEYFLSKVLPLDMTNNDFSILKSLKLLYLCSNIQDESNKDLLDIFDEFYAMPLGPVEEEIYNLIKSNKLDYFEINRFKTSFKHRYNSINDLDFSNLKQDLKDKIDDSIKLLVSKNPNIFSYNASTLVEITHLRNSWIHFYNKALSDNKYKIKMSINFIRAEEKILYYTSI